MTRRASAGSLVCAVLVSALLLPATSAGRQVPAGVPPVAVATSQADLADLWLVIYNVLPAGTSEFEAVATRVHEAMRTSTVERRRLQAAGLRVHRSALPNPDGNVVYFVQVPTETGNDADRTGLDVLIEAMLPAEATALQKRLEAVLDPRNPTGNTLMLAVR